MATTPTEKAERDSFVLRVIIVGLVGLVVALALLLIAQNITNTKYTWLKLLVESLAGTVLVAATVGLIVQRLAHKELFKAMDKAAGAITNEMKTLRAFEELGLIDAYSDCNNFSFTGILLESKDLIIVMNDGKSWVGRNAGILRKRLLLPDASTTLILQHPDSRMIPVLAHKVEQSVEFIQQKIADTVRELNSFDRASTHVLRILGHDFFNVHTLFMTEEHVVIDAVPDHSWSEHHTSLPIRETWSGGSVRQMASRLGAIDQAVETAGADRAQERNPAYKLGRRDVRSGSADP